MRIRYSNLARKRKARKSVPVVKRKGKSIVPKQAIAKVVKSVVRGMAEKKFCRYNWQFSFGAYNTSSWTGNGLQPLTPYSTFTDIAQGAQQNQRIGNRIRTHRLIFNGYIQPTIYNGTTNPAPRPQEVMMVIFSTRDDSTTLTTALPGFLNNGGSSIAPQGSLLDSIQPLNEDLYTIYHKRIFKVGFADYGGAGASTNAQNYANNDYKLVNRFYIDCTKWCPKTLKFNDADNTPTNRILYVAFLPMYYDGSAMGTALSTCQVNASWQYVFTDL